MAKRNELEKLVEEVDIQKVKASIVQKNLATDLSKNPEVPDPGSVIDEVVAFTSALNFHRANNFTEYNSFREASLNAEKLNISDRNIYELALANYEREKNENMIAYETSLASAREKYAREREEYVQKSTYYTHITKTLGEWSSPPQATTSRVTGAPMKPPGFSFAVSQPSFLSRSAPILTTPNPKKCPLCEGTLYLKGSVLSATAYTEEELRSMFVSEVKTFMYGEENTRRTVLAEEFSERKGLVGIFGNLTIPREPVMQNIQMTVGKLKNPVCPMMRSVVPLPELVDKSHLVPLVPRIKQRAELTKALENAISTAGDLRNFECSDDIAMYERNNFIRTGLNREKMNIDAAIGASEGNLKNIEAKLLTVQKFLKPSSFYFYAAEQARLMELYEGVKANYNIIYEKLESVRGRYEQSKKRFLLIADTINLVHEKRREYITEILDSVVATTNIILGEIIPHFEYFKIEIVPSSRSSKDVLVWEASWNGRKIKKLDQISGGESDRLTLALTFGLSFAHDAPFVGLDETLSSLDPDTHAIVIEKIYQIFPNKPIAVASHNFNKGHYQQCLEIVKK